MASGAHGNGLQANGAEAVAPPAAIIHDQALQVLPDPPAQMGGTDGQAPEDLPAEMGGADGQAGQAPEVLGGADGQAGQAPEDLPAEMGGADGQAGQAPEVLGGADGQVGQAPENVPPEMGGAVVEESEMPIAGHEVQGAVPVDFAAELAEIVEAEAAVLAPVVAGAEDAPLAGQMPDADSIAAEMGGAFVEAPQAVLPPPADALAGAESEAPAVDAAAEDYEMPQAEVAAEVGGNDSEAPNHVCQICQQAMVPGNGLLALECAHVFHDACIRNTWHHLAKPVGWCPNRCLDRRLAQQVPESPAVLLYQVPDEDFEVVDPEPEVANPGHDEEAFVL